jgi:peptidoglycan/LPS O-acetylase OafA/YrhL
LPYRPEIDGLRAVAVLLIVGFHVKLPGFGGGFIGVDIFFVVSGYLITRILLRWIDGTGRAALLGFWARRIRRLVPALALVVVVVLVVAVGYVYSPLRWHDLSRQGAASALYVSNILFASQATGYFEPSLTTSPFLHTWSLGVEEQFYLVWPLLFLAPSAIARRSRRAAFRLLVILLSGVTAASFALSSVLSGRDSPWAFFSSPTRAWEFGAAGLFAVLTARRTPESRWWPVLSWFGLIAIAIATLRLDSSVPYPGRAALIPVVGTIALLAPARGVSGWGPSLLLRWSALRWIGRVSYSWYLWHWPLIVFAEALYRGATTTERLAAAGLALLLAALTQRLVEDPIRFARRLVASSRRSFVIGIAMTGVAVLSAAVVAAAADNRRNDALLQRLRGARFFDVRCLRVEEGQCVLGDPAGTRSVVLLGDSHAAHWIPALDPVARAMGIRLLPRGRADCPPQTAVLNLVSRRVEPACEKFKADTLALIEAIHPAAVIVSNSTGYGGRILDDHGHVLHGQDELTAWRKGYARLLRHFKAQHVPVIVAVDNPALDFDPIECIARRRSVRQCTPSRDNALQISAPFNDAQRASLRDADYGSFYDPTNVICDSRHCRLEIAHTLVYADPDHLTHQFALAQAPAWRALLDAAITAR